IAHEMAHQWFGNLVTMQWWDDLWLNESFAEYMGYRVTAHVTSFTDVWTDFTLSRKAWGMAADQRTSTHPVAGNGAQDAQQALNDFDGISYTKGASALRQLNAYLGDQVFLAGVVDHLTQHSFGNATLADLFAAWQRHTDKDVDAWAQAWLRTSGIDTLSVAHSSAGDVVIERANGSPVEVSRPHAIQVSWYGGGTSPHTTPLLVTQPATPVTWKAADGRGLVLPDSADESWVKVRLNPATLDEVPEALATIEDPIARAVIWGALREALRDGELNPERYLQIVESALPSEADSAVEEVLSQCSSSVGRFFGDTSAAARLAAVAEQILNSVPPGSNRQLVAARAFISLTPDTDQLHRWRDGSSPEGLLTDDDLRWRITRALCGAGQLGTTDIEAELRRDPSSQGALRSLESRASLPDSEVKEDVWESITTDATLSNYSLYALAGHFFRADQLELTEPFVERYFDDVPKTARFRTGWVVQTTAQLAFPRYAVSPDTVRLAERCLARGHLDASTRRAVSDSLDDLRRALHSRTTFDGAA
ncbi:MAG: M1 family aminopeptidase, partial [Nocardioidaceae bacterium]